SDAQDSAPRADATHDSGAPHDTTAADVLGPAADLHFSAFEIALNGEEHRVRYAVTICNRGNATAAATLFAVYNDLARPPTSSDRISVQLPVPRLAPTQCVERAIAQGPLEARRYRSWGFVDVENRVLESDESNNIVRFRDFEFTQD
ncbi:MAG: hypothetical protein KC503_05695, partial [Myxococcales bacterium]|nr:hypothetical protein [Myxococcales bacterium]